MPYIAKDRRVLIGDYGLTALRDGVFALRKCKNLQAGDIAFIVYSLLLAAAPPGTRFAGRNEMMAAVDEARMEYRRQVHEPAEDEAMKRNGGIEK